MPGRVQLDLPMKREVCANCRRPKTVTRKLHKPSGRYLWLQQCRRQGCPGTTSWYDDRGERVSLKEFQGPPRKYHFPPCPVCSTDTLRTVGRARRKGQKTVYVKCKTCKRRFAWNGADSAKLRRLRGARSIRDKMLKSLPFARPDCPWRDSKGTLCGGELTCVGPRQSGRRGGYWVFRCQRCFHYSWSKDGKAHLSQVRKPRGRGRPTLLSPRQLRRLRELRTSGASYSETARKLGSEYPSLRGVVTWRRVSEQVRYSKTPR